MANTENSTAPKFLLQQWDSLGQWETIDNGEFASEAEAEAARASLETDLGWRDLRIVEADTGYSRAQVAPLLQGEFEGETLYGETVAAIAGGLPEDNTSTVEIHDEQGFTRGWARSPSDWRAQ